jgi:hypothetical protein
VLTLVNADARKRVPFAEKHAVALVALRVDDVETGDAGQLSRKSDGEHGRSGAERLPLPRTGREHDRRKDRHRGGREHDAGRAQAIQQRNQEQAACGSAEQISRVDAVDAIRQPRDRERDDEPAGEEGQGGQPVDRQHQPQVVRRVAQADAQSHQEEQRNERAQRVQKGRRRQQMARWLRRQPASPHVGEHPAGADAEQRDRDRQKREVVIHDDREDARERQFGHQQRRRHQRDTSELDGERSRRLHGESVPFRPA